MTPLTADRERQLVLMAVTIRKHILRMIHRAGSGHPGGALSAADIITALYFDVLNVDPENPDWPDRDRFVLSKGHGCPALYAALAERGFFPVQDLDTLRQLEGHLQGHPDMRKTPGVDACTGSLGQGLSQAVGMALAARLDGAAWKTYALIGDGEMQEGMIWEAAMAASHYGLGSLTAFVDFNGFQIDGRVQCVMNPEPIVDKWRAFGWHTLTIDGHSISQILGAVAAARAEPARPTAIVAATVKGKGVSFMENRAEWHGVAPSAQELKLALAELGEVD